MGRLTRDSVLTVQHQLDKMEEGLIKDTYELVIKEIQTLVTIFYLITVGIGMLFNYQKYAEFDINIFYYADVFDFLIAPFSDGYILLFASASIIIVYILIKSDILMKNRWPKIYSVMSLGQAKKSWFKNVIIITYVISAILYLYLSADIYGSYSKGKILDRSDISIRLEDNEVRSGKLIGKTKEVVFLLNDENVYAIPITSLVKEIKIR